MTGPRTVWVDGRLLPADSPHLSAFDRGFQLGDGVFETLRASGGRPTELAQHLGADLVPMGSAGIKATAVVDGTVDAYVHAGGQYEWDSAAPVAVAQASGLHASRIDGSPLQYNQADTLLPDLLIARPEAAGTILTAIEAITEGCTS